MPIVLNTIKEALSFIDNFDGFGMIAVDEDLQVEKLLCFDLINDYNPLPKTPEFHQIIDFKLDTQFGRTVKAVIEPLIEFAKKELAENPAREDSDFWSRFDDSIDVQFYVNDDPESANYNRREIWVFPIIEKRRGETETDLNTSILIAVI